MSIIYDALKKVDNSNNKESQEQSNKEDRESKPKTRMYLVYILVTCLGIFLGNIVFKFLSTSNIFLQRPKKEAPKVLAKSKPSSPTSSKPAGKKPEANPYQALLRGVLPGAIKNEPKPPPWVLNGVFFSQEEGYALINNKIAKEGDVVDGATVKKITLQEVELDSGGSTIKLSTSQSK